MYILHSTICRRVTYACVTNIRAPTGKYWGVGACVVSRTLVLVRLLLWSSIIVPSIWYGPLRQSSLLELRPSFISRTALCPQSLASTMLVSVAHIYQLPILVSVSIRSTVLARKYYLTSNSAPECCRHWRGWSSLYAPLHSARYVCSR